MLYSFRFGKPFRHFSRVQKTENREARPCFSKFVPSKEREEGVWYRVYLKRERESEAARREAEERVNV